MEQIIITKPNLSTYPIASKRTATQIKSAKQTMALLGEDVVDVNVESPFPQTYSIGDKITVFGRVYKLNQLPKVKKTGMREFSYDLQFEGVQYDLLCATYDLTIDTTTNQLQDVQADSLTGDLRRFATVLISNVCRVFPGKWVLGTCPDSKTITLTFSESDNCLSVLQNLCSADNFNFEFEIAQNEGVNTINFKKVGQVFPYTFQFGRGKGLYLLDRQNVSSSSIVTRLKVYGSTENITSKYRAQRLCLPGKSKAQSYIEKADAVAKYGIIEGRKFFDDIKPTFDGSVTATYDDTVLKFIDTNMFDLNALEADGVTTKYLIDGITPKIHFNTGNLAGYEFEIESYNHAIHSFALVKQTDDRGYEFPSESSIAFQFTHGDEYKLIDVALPETYEQAAEAKLANEGDTYYDQNCQPKVQYGLSVTKAYLQSLVGDGSTVNIFQPGDYIPVKDADIDVDKSVRIQSLTRNLLDEYDYTLTISDTISTNITNRVISKLVDIDKVVQMNNLVNPARARANWRSSREVLNMVFDPDGDYYTDKIKPNSIDTLALSVGAKSMQFGLTNTIMHPNFNGNKNLIDVQGGVLTHYTIDEESERSWNLADGETTLDSDSQAYYIYAKCQRVGTAGSIIFSTAQIKTEQDANYYHFWIGIVNSVDNGARALSLSYGFSTINGRFITTGRVQSSDQTTYFDLDNGEIGGKIKFQAGSSGYENLEDKPDLSIYAQSELVDGIKSDLQAQIDGQIMTFFDIYVPTTANAPASTWVTDNDKIKHLGDLFYNKTTGLGYRYSKTVSVYSWELLKDTDVATALANAASAQTTANAKKRVFATQPVTPYDVGDLWSQGVSGDLMICAVSRASGAYIPGDWIKSVKYTDDAKAIQAASDAAVALELAPSENLINSGLGASCAPLIAYYDSYGSSGAPLQFMGQLCASFSCASISSGGSGIFHILINHTFSAGTKLFVSFYFAAALADVITPIKIGNNKATQNVTNAVTPSISINSANTWYYIILEFDLQYALDNTCTVSLGGLDGNGCFIRDIKASLKPHTTWSPSAADLIDQAAKAVNFTSIIGGLISTTLIKVGAINSGGNWVEKAGINGAGNGNNTVRFYAGGTMQEAINLVGNLGSTKATFAVTEDGRLFATNANISGTIQSNAGSIGGFAIANGRIGGDSPDPVNPQDGLSLYNQFIKFADAFWNTSVLIGAQVISATSGTAMVGRFNNLYSNPAGTNFGIDITVKNAWYNIAQRITGNVGVNGALSSTNCCIWTPSGSGNSLPIRLGTTILIYTTSYTTVYLPSAADVRASFGLGVSDYFAVKITIVGYMKSTVVFNLYPQFGMVIKDHNGGEMSSMSMAAYDSTEFLLICNENGYYAQRLWVFA
jgi:hypothetical protein